MLKLVNICSDCSGNNRVIHALSRVQKKTELEVLLALTKHAVKLVKVFLKAQWVKGGVRNFFCRWGQLVHFSQLSRCPGLVPLTGHKICQIWDLQGPKTAQKQPKSAKMAI